jgi:hypothetical protein
LDLAISAAESTPPVAATHPLFAPPPAASVAPRVAGEAMPAPTVTPDIRREQLTDYMRAVADRRRGESR